MRRDYSALPEKLTGTCTFEHRRPTCAPDQDHHLPGRVPDFRMRHVDRYHFRASIDVAFRAGYPVPGRLFVTPMASHTARIAGAKNR
jgi:hypothetical protein